MLKGEDLWLNCERLAVPRRFPGDSREVCAFLVRRGELTAHVPNREGSAWRLELA